ncbi:MAG: hypothetical protein ACJAUC_001474 [Planctomycetota bacterium]|jgi:hypothetical protein
MCVDSGRDALQVFVIATVLARLLAEIVPFELVVESCAADA